MDRSGLRAKNGAVVLSFIMLTQTEILIALVVAAHAGVLAVRLSFSLFKA
jgi:photosystem I reaction center subunit XII